VGDGGGYEQSRAKRAIVKRARFHCLGSSGMSERLSRLAIPIAIEPWMPKDYMYTWGLRCLRYMYSREYMYGSYYILFTR